MQTYTDAMDFARASANTATDSWRDHGTLADSIHAHHINILDTLTVDYPAMSVHVADALRAYYSRIATDIAGTRREEERAKTRAA
jgi:hypothetical protein